MKIFLYLVCFCIHFVFGKTINSTAFTRDYLTTLVAHLQGYNDIAIENIIILHYMQEYSHHEGLVSVCEKPDDLQKHVTIWYQYVNVDQYEDYLPRLTKLLKKKKNSLVIICDCNPIITINKILQNIPDYFLSENTVILLKKFNAVNVTNKLELLLDGIDTTLASKIKLDSQLYILEQNNTVISLSIESGIEGFLGILVIT